MEAVPRDSKTSLRTSFVELAASFRCAALFFASFELDLYARIPDDGVTAGVLARALGVEELPVRLLLNALAAMGVLTKQGETFFVPPAHAALLRPGPDYIGPHVLLHKEQNLHWLAMVDVIKGRDPGPSPFEQLLGSERLPHYLDTVEDANRPYADLVLARLGPVVPSARRLLDIGGGHGYFARRFLEVNPDATATVLDLEATIAHCRSRQRTSPHHDRFEFVVGSALTHEYDSEFDLVVVNDVLHYFPFEEKREILRRATRALRHGGTLAVSKFRLTDDGVEPAPAALFSLKIYMQTLKSYQETDRETIELLREAGAEEVRAVPMDEIRTLITARPGPGARLRGATA